MPLFISYSRSDKEFAERLALQLVAHHVNVWIDSWELNVGDSLITKIQEAITGASGLLVILSKASVQSEWCKKELNSGLMRELEEKRVVVLPVLIEDCERPLFLLEKQYADFRTNFDQGLEAVLEAVAKVTNEWQGRIEEPEWHTDWAIDWGTLNNDMTLRLTMVEQAKGSPYVVLGTVTIIGDSDATKVYNRHAKAGTDHIARRDIIIGLANEVRDASRYDFILNDQMEQTTLAVFHLESGSYGATIAVRRLGIDTGRSVVFHFGSQIGGIADAMEQITKESTHSKSPDATDATKVVRVSTQPKKKK